MTITPNPGAPGFITKVGNGTRWGRSGTNQAFVPQLAMFVFPDYVHRDPSLIQGRIEIFVGDHGFNGFHVVMLCRWFDIDEAVCGNLGNNPNPDRRTFRALERVIQETYAAGGIVHFWLWGDEQKQETPIRWGINGKVDRRLQRYIAARLGPLPGWSASYGFDLDEWVGEQELEDWRDFMHSRLGWFHFLGGRPEGPNSGPDHSAFVSWNKRLDYSSYEHHKPTYDVYRAALGTVPGQPVMSEDRFRIRTEARTKDYDMVETRRGLWDSTMAGGVANIWGFLRPQPEDRGSLPYPNAHQILTYSRFWKNRFNANLVWANSLTDGVALRQKKKFYVFYKQNASSIKMNLSKMAGPRQAVAVNTQRIYEEIPLGVLSPGRHTFTASNQADWAIAVGGPFPDSSVSVDLGNVDNEEGLYRIDTDDGDTEVVEIDGRESRRNRDPAIDRYIHFNVVGAFAYRGDRPAIHITVDYFDNGPGDLRLEYDSFSSPFTTHPEVAPRTGSQVWKQKTWTLADAFFGNGQNDGADFRIFPEGDGVFYLDVVNVSEAPLGSPGPAFRPNPGDGAIDVSLQADLTWSSGPGATSHDVFFGTTSPPSFQGSQSETGFDPGTLDPNATYFWRIDEVNEGGTTEGPEWSFTTRTDLVRPTLSIKPAGTITIDGRRSDWNLGEFTTMVRGGDVVSGDIALVGFDNNTLHYAGRATNLALPTKAADHTALVYARHDAAHLYFLVRIKDVDIQTSNGKPMNWANDCVEIYIDPTGNGGSSPLSSSTSAVQLVIDAANRVNVYATTGAYKNQILSGVTSAISRNKKGWWLELRIDKSVLDGDLSASGVFGLDFNFRDNDRNNNPNRSTVYTWADTEQSSAFPSKIPDRWGEGALDPLP